MPLSYSSEEEINELAEEFTSHVPEENKWTHNAHLTAAVWHLKKFDLHEATCFLRSGIISYNLSLGNKNNGSQGYHETLTVLWISVVYFFIQRDTPKTLSDTCNAFLASILADKTLPFYFLCKRKYSFIKSKG